MWKKIKPYVISIAIALAVGALSGFLSMEGMENFETFNQPPLSPPGILFPIVWTILYTLMGISSAIVWQKGKGRNGRALFIYALQLAVNFFWSLIFFNLNAFLFAFIWLLLLFVLIVLMIIEFYKIDKTAAYLQIPYLLWVSFAGYLTFMTYLLN